MARHPGGKHGETRKRRSQPLLRGINFKSLDRAPESRFEMQIFPGRALVYTYLLVPWADKRDNNFVRTNALAALLKSLLPVAADPRDNKFRQIILARLDSKLLRVSKLCYGQGENVTEEGNINFVIAITKSAIASRGSFLFYLLTKRNDKTDEYGKRSRHRLSSARFFHILIYYLTRDNISIVSPNRSSSHGSDSCPRASTAAGSSLSIPVTFHLKTLSFPAKSQNDQCRFPPKNPLSSGRSEVTSELTAS